MNKMDTFLIEQCLKQATDCTSYLQDKCKISTKAVEFGIKSKTLGYSSSPAFGELTGKNGHGSPAVVFVCHDSTMTQVDCLEYLYVDPTQMGGHKKQHQGNTASAFWSISHDNLKAAHTVVLVESPVEALSVESAIFMSTELNNWAALAVIDTSELGQLNWSLLKDKRVIIAMNHYAFLEDGPNTGYRPGDLVSWHIHEALLEQNIPCHFTDDKRWGQLDSPNNLLKENGAEHLARIITSFDSSLIPGLPRSKENAPYSQHGKPRVCIPKHDLNAYLQFRVNEDFTFFQKTVTDKSGEYKVIDEDLCGFRIAALSRLRIQSANATMTGQKDHQPNIVFSATVQNPRHGNTLTRKVLTDNQLYNVEWWSSFAGAIYNAQKFKRMLNIMERATHIGGRNAVNFVGLAWKDGNPVLNEGPDCYFSEPDKQCPYHNLQFPSGSSNDAMPVIQAYQATFGLNAATFVLAWGLGGHLKAYLGFWPHMVMQAEKSTGKSTLIKSLERSICFTMFSGQSLQSEFRLVTSISHTSHPVGWEELSARPQRFIDKAVALLQETYQYTINRRGADLTEFVLCAPVLLAGEDVPIKSLLGKVIRTELAHRGELIPENLPVFPIREWLIFLESQGKSAVTTLFENHRNSFITKQSNSARDASTERMLNNYAALATAWSLLCEFAGIPASTGDFIRDLTRTMNKHLLESSADRQSWVWIMEVFLGEIDAGNYSRPYKFEKIGNDILLFVRVSHLMQHMSQTPSLRQTFDALPVKSDRVLKQQLNKVGVIPTEFNDKERHINGNRVAHMCGLSLNKLEEYGLSPIIPENLNYSKRHNNAT